MKETEKKQTHFLRIAMMVLTTILIVLFFMIMSMVGKIQGTDIEKLLKEYGVI